MPIPSNPVPRICAALLLLALRPVPPTAAAPSPPDPPRVDLLFGMPDEHPRPGDRCGNEPCRRLLEAIEGAEDQILFAVYGMRDQSELLDALLAAKKRGVEVRGVVDRERGGGYLYSSTPEWIRRLGPETIRDDAGSQRGDGPGGSARCSAPEGFDGWVQCLAYDLGDRWLLATHASREPVTSDPIMHHKFFIVDGARVWTGSANISDSGTGGYNANAVLDVVSSAVATLYRREWEQLWNGSFHGDKTGDGVDRVRVGDSEVFAFFSPQDRALRWAVQARIARARERIDVGIFFLTDTYVAAELIGAHRRGVRVRVIVDATSATNGYTKHELLRAAGVPLRLEPWGGKMHMKAAAFDGEWLVAGSMNWTAAGQRTNDENTLMIRSSPLAEEFHEVHGRLWDSIPARWGEPGARPDPESFDSGDSCSDGADNDFDELVDEADPGCGAEPPPLPELPPHWFASPEDVGPEDGGRLEANAGSFQVLRAVPCDPNYPEDWMCLPQHERWRRLRCRFLPYWGFRVLRPDPYRFDGDLDGVACESRPRP